MVNMLSDMNKAGNSLSALIIDNMITQIIAVSGVERKQTSMALSTAIFDALFREFKQVNIAIPPRKLFILLKSPALVAIKRIESATA